ncbi:MAG TPA: ABC transporter permease [Blastocatellia bacterium]|nr:ABC transporter permease [Blastocatellia bacterium]
MDTFLQDLRYALRMLLKKPVFTSVAVLALALGIGATSAIFSVVNPVLLRSLPYREPSRLVFMAETFRGRTDQSGSVSYPNFTDWRDRSESFEHLAAFTSKEFILRKGDSSERLHGASVSTDLFPLLGVNPERGRAFLPEEDKPGSSQVVIISHALWQQHFGEDPDAVGSTLSIDAKSFTIVGVMPLAFRFPFENERADLWVPVGNAFPDWINEREAHFLSVVGRLKQGVEVETAQSEMTAIAASLADTYPDSQTGYGVDVTPLHQFLVADIRSTLLLLLAAVGIVLLIACSNVANLLLAKATARQKEFALRAALGASRRRIVRQLLTESLLLALVGGCLGLLLALWGIEPLVRLAPEDIPRLHEVALDGRVLAVTALVTILTGLIFGLVPAVRASKPDLNEAMKEGSRGTSAGAGHARTRSALVVVEVAMALMLLVWSGLMIKTLSGLQHVDPGFKPENVVTIQTFLPDSKYDETAKWSSLYKQLVERTSEIPGVQSAAAVTSLPLSGDHLKVSFEVEGAPPVTRAERSSPAYWAISPDYFATMGVRLLKGRAFTERDNAKSPPVLIVNESTAREYFPGGDPIGKRARIGYNDLTCEIVGIVADVKDEALEKEAGPGMYLPYEQTPWWFMSVVVRTTSDPATIATAVRREAATLDRDMAAGDARTMQQYLSAAVAGPRFIVLLLEIFGGVAVILAALGIYGVISYSVTQRTHEIGIRMALGATGGDVLRLVLGQGMRLTIMGVLLGVGASVLSTRLISGMLYGVRPTDLATLVAVSVGLTGVALIASFIPARRATRVDPMVALRCE